SLLPLPRAHPRQSRPIHPSLVLRRRTLPRANQKRQPSLRPRTNPDCRQPLSNPAQSRPMRRRRPRLRKRTKELRMLTRARQALATATLAMQALATRAKAKATQALARVARVRRRNVVAARRRRLAESPL